MIETQWQFFLSLPINRLKAMKNCKFLNYPADPLDNGTLNNGTVQYRTNHYLRRKVIKIKQNESI